MASISTDWTTTTINSTDWAGTTINSTSWNDVDLVAFIGELLLQSSDILLFQDGTSYLDLQ